MLSFGVRPDTRVITGLATVANSSLVNSEGPAFDAGDVGKQLLISMVGTSTSPIIRMVAHVEDYRLFGCKAGLRQ